MEHFIGIYISKATLDLATRPGPATWIVTNDEEGHAQLTPRLLALAPVVVVLEATGGFELLAALTLANAGVAREVALITALRAKLAASLRSSWRYPLL